ncbi:hypothetical protein [Hydrocoleum sp. CS-953]|uniref:hypothetical protein n=1 Tax=Hydrocoleum sp. CS-953 TaxID=1671698 RepID=UPI000B9BDDAB|nr:hypothetical protein [Hydrocoleum sp. CS-953]
MRKIELGGLVTLLTGIVTLAFFFGQLNAQVKSLKPEEIQKAQEKALEAIKEAKEKNSLEAIENVRTIVTKSDADKYCSSVDGAFAAHVPRSYFRRTGEQICAADNPTVGKPKQSCAQVPFIWVSNDNNHGGHIPKNKGCNEFLEFAWPWGASHTKPNTLSREWNHGDTWVVCCFEK